MRQKPQQCLVSHLLQRYRQAPKSQTMCLHFLSLCLCPVSPCLSWSFSCCSALLFSPTLFFFPLWSFSPLSPCLCYLCQLTNPSHARTHTVVEAYSRLTVHVSPGSAQVLWFQPVSTRPDIRLSYTAPCLFKGLTIDLLHTHHFLCVCVSMQMKISSLEETTMHTKDVISCWRFSIFPDCFLKVECLNRNVLKTSTENE